MLSAKKNPCNLPQRMIIRLYWLILAVLILALLTVNLIIFRYGNSIARMTIISENRTTDADTSFEVDVTDTAGFLIVPSFSCKDRHVELLICVPIKRDNAAGRNVIRATWGSIGGNQNPSSQNHNASGGLDASGAFSAPASRPDVALIFFVGSAVSSATDFEQESLEQEAIIYGDIVQDDFLDTYENLTLKSISVLKYVTRLCPNARYLLKIDDDMYVNIPLLLQRLQDTTKSIQSKSPNVAHDSTRPNSTQAQSHPPPPFLLGYLIHHAMPIRNKKSKWYTPAEAYNEKYYPDYMSGTGYAMSVSAAHRLYEASPKVPVFWMEDIYVTGMCAKAAGVPLVKDYRFHLEKVQPSGCTFRNTITGHRYTKAQIYKIHTELYSATLKCS